MIYRRYVILLYHVFEKNQWFFFIPKKYFCPFQILNSYMFLRGENSDPFGFKDKGEYFDCSEKKGSHGAVLPWLPF